MENKWYKKSFRRGLIDMHIEDWNDEFLSQFEPENFLQYIKTANMDAIMLQMQTHVGLCYFPTKTGVMHKAFVGKEDQMKRLVRMCQENGIAVVGYYSLGFNNRTEELHPEWGIKEYTEEKESQFVRKERRYGWCCFNNPEYRERTCDIRDC